MPVLTPKLGLKKPLGNETVNRAAYSENLDIMDTAAASQAEITNHKTATILDHPDGSVSDAKIGQRTISDATAPTGDTGTLTSLLGSLAYMIKAITGKANWRTAPAINLETVAKRFWMSGCVGGTPGTMYSINGGAAVDVQRIIVALGTSLHIRLKHAFFSTGGAPLRLQVSLSSGNTWTSTVGSGDESLDVDLGTGTIQIPFPEVVVRIYNPESTAQNYSTYVGWCFEFEKV